MTMPIVNTYYTSDKHKDMVISHIDEMKMLVAKELTCVDISLQSSEITLHLINTPAAGMLAEIELEIFAHPFKERIEKQDKICMNIRKHILKNVPDLKDVKVWLVLGELGHSWD
jgi:hypothetical protein